MEIIRRQEFEFTQADHDQITRLRNQCFPGHHAERSYYKQLPHFRYQALREGRLVGHLGVDHRVIRVGERVLRIFGVVDLCVDPAWRGQGIASRLLGELRDLATRNQIDFLLLICQDQRLYRKIGFQPVTAYCAWLRIDEHQNYGVAFEPLEGELMTLKTGETDWPEGPVDFLGYLF